MAEHTKNTYIKGYSIMVNKPERAHLGEGAPETVVEMFSSLGPGETKANQVLFSAAPDLLEALEGVMQLIEEGTLVRNTKNDGDPSWAIKQWPLVQTLSAAATAIAKARGKEGV